MRTGHALAVLLAGALLVVLGITGGVPGVEEDAPDREPTTTTPAAGTYPPGVDEDGIADLKRLLAAHRSSLRSSGFVVVTERTYRSTGETNFTLRREIAATRDLGSVSVRRVRRGDDTGRSVVATWTNGSTALVAFDGPDRPLRVREGGDSRRAANGTGITGLVHVLQWAEFDVVAVIRDGGQSRYTLRATGYDDENRSRREPDRVGVSVRVVVSGDGRIHTVQSSVNRIWTTNGSRRSTLEVYTYRLVRTGVETLSPPEWVRRAGNRTEADRSTAGRRTGAVGSSGGNP